MLTRQAAFVACVVLLVGAAHSGADEVCRSPVVNKQGFRPQAVVAYTVDLAPGGKPFPLDKMKCVDRAFDAWTKANVLTGLQVRFVRGSGGIVVRFDRQGGLVLQQGTAGAWAEPVRSPDGHLQQASIWLSSDSRLLTSCDGLTKVILHELGHLHGLRDNAVYRGPSVMNRASRRDDTGGKIPFTPTACDAAQARSASAFLLARHEPLATVPTGHDSPH